MDKNTAKMLRLDFILAMIEPAGDCGKYFSHHLITYLPGQENQLRKEYQRLSVLFQALREDNHLAEKFQNVLAHLAWLPQLIKALETRSLHTHELFELKQFVHFTLQLEDLCAAHNLRKWYPLPNLRPIYRMLDPEQQKTPAFHLSHHYHKSLASCLQSMQQLQMQKRQLELVHATEAKNALNLASPKKEIVVSRLQADQVKQLEKSRFYHLAEENYANLTFKLLETQPVKSINRRLAALSIRLQAVETQVLQMLSERLIPYAARLATAQRIVSQLDWDFAKARFMLKYNCVIPVISRTNSIHIVQGVNLPVLQSQAASGNVFQPVSLEFNAKVNVLTGPNMGGKTTALKTLGQLCALTSLAIPLPAQSARLCLFDSIWYNHDDSETESLSSFGKEVVALSAILRKRNKLLLLLDELAKGTNPQEGEAILTAVLQFAGKLPGICLAATHFDKPNALKRVHRYAIRGIDEKLLKNWDNAVNQDLPDRLKAINGLMDYSLVRMNKHSVPPRNAISIAALLGLPQEMITTATKLIK